MEKRWSLKNRNQGASLLAVLVVMIVVSVIALIMTRITLANIEMKEVERGSRKNFYSADAVMDDLSVGVNKIAATALEDAYTDVLENYSNYVEAGKSLQKQFAKKYMELLQNAFWDGTSTQQTSTETLDSSAVLYTTSKYGLDKLKKCMATENQSLLTTAAEDATYSVDYGEGVFTLKNVSIAYRDAQDYETTIKTDLTFQTPTVNFTGTNQSAAFMKYSLIADGKISVGARNVKVGGNVYAGADGIVGEMNSSAAFTGDVLVTRGNISTTDGAELTIGNGSSGIWAQNIETVGNGWSELSLNGSCYVEDDLTLDSRNSVVNLSGRYYGYNFQKNYDTLKTETDAAFSSAMMINAQGCKLSLENLQYLMIAGRTFISRGSKGNTQNNDIMLGESLAVRTNQLAYYVPDDYLEAGDDKKKFTAEGIKKYEKDTGVTGIASYLDSEKQVAAYKYIDNVTKYPTANYYLNFASEEKANEFFAAYYKVQKGQLNSYASLYAKNDAIILDSSRIFTLRGDVMYRTTSGGELKDQKVSIDLDDWSSGGAYWNYSSRLAMRYKSLQLGLTETYDGVSASDVRITKDGEVDKTANPLFENLVDVQALKDGVNANSGTGIYKVAEKSAASGTSQVVVLVDNKGGSRYEIPTNYTEGIIVATGDVYVAGSFKGMILSGGTISFASNAEVKSDESMVQDLFTEDVQKALPQFVPYFKEGSSAASAAIGAIDVDSYVSYENWKKNE